LNLKQNLLYGKKIKNSKVVKAATFIFRIRIRLELPTNALPEGRGENIQD